MHHKVKTILICDLILVWKLPFMLFSEKEKSWKVLLIKGHVLNDQVRAERCEDCKSTNEVLTTNYNNPNLLLYGCRNSKCRHNLLRLDFNSEMPQTISSS